MNEPEAVTLFYTQNDQTGWRAVVLGRVLSLGAREIADKELRQLAQEKTKVTVRLKHTEGIMPGNTLYIINDKNLIVAKFEVTTMFKSASFGYLLIGYGNFRRVQKDFRVVQRKEETASQYAYIHNARGDYHREKGDKAQAIFEYEKAIKKNSAHAESHIALGNIYLADGVYEYALKEFYEAYKTRDFIHDKEELFQLYKGIIQIHYYNAYESQVIDTEGVQRNIENGMETAKDALLHFPDDPEIHFYLGSFYYNNPNPDDIKARDHMIKVIEEDQWNVEAHVILARLYLRHDNEEKALHYTEKALELDPTNAGAQSLFTELSLE
jgi:tetratricopeptide (TPR) repeat protein